MPWSTVAELCGSYLLNFLKKLPNFSRVVILFYAPIIHVWAIQFLCILGSIWCCHFLRKYILKYFIYFWREGKGGREGEKHWCESKTLIVASHMHPERGLNLQPRHVSQLGIEAATSGLAGWCSTNWAIPVRAVTIFCVSQFDRCVSNISL